MTKKASTPSFIVELPLRTTAEDERLLKDRLECAKRMNNALLKIGFDMIAKMRSSVEWQEALVMPGKTQAAKDKRTQIFIEIRKTIGFTKENFDALVAIHAKAAGFNKRIGSHELQVIAKKVFNALNDWIKRKKGKPRFKGYKRPLHSVEGKNNNGMLRWFDGDYCFQMEKGWRIEVVMPDLKKKQEEWLALALQSRTKYCRLVWRDIAGVRRWYVQLIQEGLTPIASKHLIARTRVSADTEGGIDIGPSWLAYATDTEAGKLRFCDNVERQHKHIRILQRQIDRQRRVNNPGNFNADGTCKKGAKKWIKSNRQIQAEYELKELQRVEAAMRKTAHGTLANTLLTKASIWKDDGVSPKAMQALWGKSISVRAPGILMNALERKAERAGGERVIINVRTLKNSQYDHTTGIFTKKPLSQRKHIFGDNRGWVDRDVYSAFLAKNSEENTYIRRDWKQRGKGWKKLLGKQDCMSHPCPGAAVKQRVHMR